MSLISLPPCVALPDGRWAAFAPDVFAGVFTDKQSALRAARAAGLLARPAQPPPLGPHGRAFATAWTGFDTRAEGALAVARHHKPLSEDEVSTEAQYYLPALLSGQTPGLAGGGAEGPSLRSGRHRCMTYYCCRLSRAVAMGVTMHIQLYAIKRPLRINHLRSSMVAVLQ
jgi:hypothetical protein